MGTVQGDAMEPLAFCVPIKGSPLQEKVKRKWEKAKCGVEINHKGHNFDKAKFDIAEKLKNAEQRREKHLMRIRNRARRHFRSNKKLQDEENKSIEALEKLQFRMEEAELKRGKWLRQVKDKAAKPSIRAEMVQKDLERKQNEMREEIEWSLKMAEQARAARLEEMKSMAANHVWHAIALAKKMKEKDKNLAMERERAYLEKQKAAAASRERFAAAHSGQHEQSTVKSMVEGCPSTPEKVKPAKLSSSPENKRIHRNYSDVLMKKLNLADAVIQFDDTGIPGGFVASKFSEGSTDSINDQKGQCDFEASIGSPERAHIPIMFHVTNESFGEENSTMPFDRFADLIANPQVLRSVQRILLEIEGIRAKRIALNDICSKVMDEERAKQQVRYPSRVFLAAYMIVNYPEIVLSGTGVQESKLVTAARKMLHAFETLLYPLSRVTKSFEESKVDGFDDKWAIYHDQFHIWKSHDAAGLEAELIRAAVELEISRLAKLAAVTDRARHTSDIEALSAGVDHDLSLIEERIETLTGELGVARLKAALASARTTVSQTQESSGTKALTENKASNKENENEKDSMNHEASRAESSEPRKDSPVTEMPRGMDNLSLMWQLLYTPEWRLPTDLLEYQWKEVLGKSSPNDTDSTLDTKPELLLQRQKEEEKWMLVETTLEDSSFERRLRVVTKLLLESLDHLRSLSPQTIRQEIDNMVSSEDSLLESLKPKTANDGPVQWLSFDFFIELINWISQLIQKLCAPCRDNDIRQAQRKMAESVQELISGSVQTGAPSKVIARAIRMVSIQSKILGMDVANAHLNALTAEFTGLSLALRVTYARTKFAHELQIEQGDSEDICHDTIISKLPNTRAWLAVASGKIPRFESELGSQNLHSDNSTCSVDGHETSIPAMKTGTLNLSSSNHENQASDRVLLKLKRPVELNSWRGLIRIGLVHLVSGDGVMGALNTPETLIRDVSHLHELQNHFQRIFVLSVCMKLLHGASIDGDTKLKAKERINAILLDPNVSLRDISIELSRYIISKRSEIEDVNALSTDMESLLKSLLHRSSLEGRHIVERLNIMLIMQLTHTAVSDAKSKNFLINQCKDLGAMEILDDIEKLGTSMQNIAAVSEAVCAPWYKTLYSEFNIE
eukprot:jgi/Picsp_1/4916/NSC_02280-R1_t-complex protein 11